MNHFVFTIYILLAFICISCETSSLQNEIYNRMARRVAEQEKRKHNLSLCTFGSGGLSKTDVFGFDLGGVKKVNIKEARTLYFTIANEILDIINTDQSLRPFLANYPFTIENLQLSIDFYKAPHIFVDPPYVAFVFNVKEKNRLVYSYYDNVKHQFDQSATIRESLEGALEISRKEK